MWPAHSAEFGLKEVMRAVEEIRREQQDQMASLEQKLDMLHKSQASFHRQLFTRLDPSGAAGRAFQEMQRAAGTNQTSSSEEPLALLQDASDLAGNKLAKPKKHRSHTKEMETLRKEAESFLEPKATLPPPKSLKESSDPIVRLGNSVSFKIACSLIIMASILCVAMETNQTASQAMGVDLCMSRRGPAPEELDLSMFKHLEYGFVCWMTLELCVNLRTTGALCSGPDWKWNIFDLVILVSSALQMFLDSMASMVGMTRSLRLGRLMKFIRVMRLAKVMKVLKVFRHLHGVRKMILSMIGSLSTLLWALFLMFFLTFLVGVLLLQGVEMHFKEKIDFLSESGALGPECLAGVANSWDDFVPASDLLPMFSVDPEQDISTEQVVKLYSSVQKSMLTLFASISGGTEWPVVADPLMRIHWIFAGVWIVFICLMIFGVLNILTGIFCEAAMQAAASDRVAIIMKDREEKETAAKVLRHSFESIDEDNSGMLTKEEFLQLLADEEVVAMCTHIGLDTSEAGGLFNLLDDDDSGTIQFEEFLQGCLNLKGGAQKMDIMHLTIMNRKMMMGMVSTMEMIDEMWTALESERSGSKLSQQFEESI